MLPSITIQYTQAGSLRKRLDAIKEAGFTAVNLGSPMCMHLLRSTAGEIGILLTAVLASLFFPIFHLRRDPQDRGRAASVW